MNKLAAEITEKTLSKGEVCVWWIGQEGFVIKTARSVIYIDPYLSSYIERVTQGKPDEHVLMDPPPLRPEDVDHADIVICTHDHADHIDPESIPIIAKKSPNCQYVAPCAAEKTLLDFGIPKKRIHVMRGEDKLSIDGLVIHAFPAKHEEFNWTSATGYPYLSYLLDIDGVRLFHAGDTIPYEGQAQKIADYGVDIAFLPINGRDENRRALGFQGNFSCEEAVNFTLEINAKLTIPMHYDKFKINTATVSEFARIAELKGINYKIMKSATAMILKINENI